MAIRLNFIGGPPIPLKVDGEADINLNADGSYIPPVDQTFNPLSKHAQSGTAVAEAIIGYATEEWVTEQINALDRADATAF